MKWMIAFLLMASSTVLFSFDKITGRIKINEITVKAPFGMPNVKQPDFSNCLKIYITDFGAVPGDKEKTSNAIAKAIDTANKIGGGMVIIPGGEWLTRKIHLKSNVNLHLEKGNRIF